MAKTKVLDAVDQMQSAALLPLAPHVGMTVLVDMTGTWAQRGPGIDAALAGILTAKVHEGTDDEGFTLTVFPPEMTPVAMRGRFIEGTGPGTFKTLYS
jgi:hypothetical protein